jgi:4-amino-4-deoxy-L-arabinose transferase-like glycosyltransferase
MRDWLITPGPRRDIPLLMLLLLVLYVGLANHAPFGSSNRYYEAAREMVELGDWTMPHLSYAPYLEKPPLVYWMGAAARLLGDHPLIANLPSLLATMVSIIATYLWGYWWRGPGIGLGAAALLLGTSFAQAMSGVLGTDTLLAACVGMAWVWWWRWDNCGRLKSAYLWGFYLAVALGWLAKGPIALALPAAAIGLYVLLGGGWSSVLRTLAHMKPWWGMVIILALNSPWTLALWLRDPRLVEFFYLRINLDAFTTGTYNHAAPWHFYFPILAGTLTPFTLFALPMLILALGQTVRSVRFQRYAWTANAPKDPTLLFLACVVMGCFLLLSISSAKLGTYLMPIMPAIMLLLADQISRWTTTPRWITAIFALQVVVMVIALALAPLVILTADEAAEQGQHLIFAGIKIAQGPDLTQIDWQEIGPIFFAVALLLLALIGGLCASLLNRFRLALGLLGSGMAVALTIGIPTVERLVPHRDSTNLISELRAHGGDDQNVPPAQRDKVIIHETSVHDYELLLALGRRAIIYGKAREVGLGHFVEVTPHNLPAPGPGQPLNNPYEVSGNNTVHPWLWSDQQLLDAWRGPERIWLIGDASLVNELTPLGIKVHIISPLRRKALMSNQP